MTSLQNIWQLKGVLSNRQKRRSQVVKKCLTNNSKTILDIGCAEGFATNFIIDKNTFVVGIELNFDYLLIAKSKVKGVFFINASIDHLPFRDNYFDGVSILEVLEHLPSELQHRGLQEANRVLRSSGIMVISVPYKEQIISTNCIHCKKDTPLYGHLHELDENKVSAILPEKSFNLVEQYNIPNLMIISCSKIFMIFPLSLWLKINNLLGKINILKGYWIVLKYIKL
jgi:ubiquinone/menaquinone biosynthesis C-methylase UbiE